METTRLFEISSAGARFAVATVSTAVLATALLGCTTPGVAPGSAPAASSREDIYVLRSIREERTPNSPWCTVQRSGFAPFDGGFHLDDRFSMWSVRAQPANGRIADAKVGKVGEIHTCTGPTADPRVLNFYLEGQIAALPVAGNGNCNLVRPDYPEPGIATFQCSIALRGLPPPYVGGLLATSSIVSKAVIGGETDPPGYVQASISTMRLWRTKSAE